MESRLADVDTPLRLRYVFLLEFSSFPSMGTLKGAMSSLLVPKAMLFQ